LAGQNLGARSPRDRRHVGAPSYPPIVHPRDHLAGLSGAAAARGYAWGERVARTLRAQRRALPPWPGWTSSKVRSIARRLVRGLGSTDDTDELARICELEAARRYERLRSGAAE